jgi:hypothetical protein
MPLQIQDLLEQRDPGISLQPVDGMLPQIEKQVAKNAVSDTHEIRGMVASWLRIAGGTQHPGSESFPTQEQGDLNAVRKHVVLNRL